MEIKFYNTPEPQKFDSVSLPAKPNFIDYRPDFVLMEKLAVKFAHKKNLIVIGHGGSVTSFKGSYNALKSEADKSSFVKEVYFISTIDPDYIAEIKSLTSKEDTVVVAISKSGDTVTQIEALMQLIDYEFIFVTGAAGPLAQISEKLNATHVIHPPIGGRYTGFTEVGLLPAALCGLDVKAIFEAGHELLQKYNENNIVFEAASRLSQLEQKGIVDVFMPVYSEELFAFSNLVVQLCHESFGKDGKGQTYFAHQAPESQHHTNQRFFGGQKNIAGWFIGARKSSQDIVTQVPENLQDIPFKTQTLGVLNDIPLQSALQFEREATLEDAKLQNIPVVDMLLENITSAEVGEFMAFWQLYAVYGSVLRGVNPFDQPQVEASKKISFTKREQFKGSL